MTYPGTTLTIFILNIVKVFLQDQLLRKEISLKSYMRHKHNWSKEEYEEYFTLYMHFINEICD